MAATFTSTMFNASSDYMHYLFGQPVKTSRYKDSTIFDFALAPIDEDFVKLERGAYIDLDTTVYPHWFTGYILNDPELTYLGVNASKEPVWGYKYQATSDPYILSVKSLGLMPPFMNKTMGSILKRLVDLLQPGIFDVSEIDDGPLVAVYTIDPEKKFFDISKDFCESASFVFYGNDHKLYFKSQDDADAGGVVLDGDNKHFTPSRLSIKPSTAPIINDVVVLGDVEPQAYVQEYFVGTGLDSAFPLLSGVFGADTAVLLDETFNSSSFNSSNWEVFDAPQDFLVVSQGYLNCVGGEGDGDYGISLRSVSPIPLEGKLKLTHGEWDFISGDGFIAGLWTGDPNSSYTGCEYALKVTGTTINPVVAGALDAVQSFTIDTTKRYVIRTLVEFFRYARSTQAYSYVDAAGVVQSVSVSGGADSASWQTVITEVDPADGRIIAQKNFYSTSTLNPSTLYATYVPLASDTLHATVTGITISVPVNATLETSTIIQLKDPSFEQWDNDTTPTRWDNPINVFKEDTFANTGNSCKFDFIATGNASVEQSGVGLIEEDTSYSVSFRAQRSSDAPLTGFLRVIVEGTGLVISPFQVTIADLQTHYESYSGILIPGNGIVTVPSDIKIAVQASSFGGGNVGAVWIDDIVITSLPIKQTVGPNEVDAMDGLAPYATIIPGNQGSDTKSSILGSSQYNPGQSQLVFFKDSYTRESTTPPLNQLIRLAYRSAAPAVGRSVNRWSVNAEALKWNDNGMRTVIRKDLSPRPRTSLECEVAAAALASENSFTHYEGSYSQFSEYFDNEPMAGGIFGFSNLDNMITDLQAEQITEVRSTYLATKPNDLFQHDISFGQPDRVRKLLNKFSSPKGSFQKNVAPASIPAFNSDAIGLSHAPDVTKAYLVGWDEDSLHVNTGQALGSNGLYFEVRYTDAGWGVDDGKNLVTRVTSQAFSVPRSDRGRVFFIRQANKGNLLLNSEDQTQASYSGITLSLTRVNDIESNQAFVSTAAGAANATLTSSFTATGATNHCFSLSFKGVAGKTITMSHGSTTATYVCSGHWQRFSLAIPGTLTGAQSVSMKINQAMTFYTTRWSVEGSTSTERSYSKTTDVLYGPVSRYASAIRVAFPTPPSLASVDLSSLVLIPTY